MFSRRVAIGTVGGFFVAAGAVVVGARTGTLADVADAIGIEPHPEPAEKDKALIRKVRTEQSVLLKTVTAASVETPDLDGVLKPLIENLEQQQKHLGGSDPKADAKPVAKGVTPALTFLVTAHEEASERRASQANAAVSSDFAVVLGAISCGLSQNAAVLKTAAGKGTS